MIALLASALIAAGAWAPLAQPEPVVVVEAGGGNYQALTEVVAHGDGFAALRRSGVGWDLLTSADGRSWDATFVAGGFAANNSPVALTTAGDDLLAFELSPGLVMWRSADGRRWQRTDLGNPWPQAAGLRLDSGGLGVRHVAGLIHVYGNSTAHAEWEELLGVPAHLVVPQLSDDDLVVQVTSGDREGTYAMQLTAEPSAVRLRIVDAGGNVMGEQRFAPITDPDEFVELFIACGGFSPMEESWWFELDGTPTEPPAWLAALGDYPVVATTPDATFRLDEYGVVFRLGDDGGWAPAPRPTSLVQSVFSTGNRVLLVGEEAAAGLTVWERDGNDWRRLPTPAIDGSWLAAVAPIRGGAVLLYDTDGPAGVTAVVLGRDGRARTSVLDVPGGIWGLTIDGGTALVRTVSDDSATSLWAWTIEWPEPGPRSPH